MGGIEDRAAEQRNKQARVQEQRGIVKNKASKRARGVFERTRTERRSKERSH